MKKLSIFNLLFCLTFLTSCNETSEPSSLKVKPATDKISAKMVNCQLSMGWDPWEPYQYLTPDDEVKGLEIELVSAIAKEAGCSLKFVQDNWMNLLDGIKNGGIDILGGASKTPARENFAIFSNNYRQESFVLYVRKNEAVNYSGKTLEDILNNNFKLGVTENYIYGEMVSSLQDQVGLQEKFVSVPTSEVNFYHLIQNQIDGFLEDPFVAGYTIKRKGLQGQIEAHPIKIHSGDVALMFSKKSVKPEIVNAFNKALEKLKQTGHYQKILNKYRF